MACYDLLDQTLDAGAEKAVLDHIGHCPVCRAFLETEAIRMRTWPRLLGIAAGDNTIPEDATERVAHALDVSHGRNRLRWAGKDRNRLPRPFRGLLALAASLLLLAGAGWMMRHARSSGPGGSGRIVAHTVTGVRSRRIRLVSQTGACGVELPDAAAGTVRLKSGFARILLPVGVELTLQGPIELHVLGEREVRLRHGSVLAWVPQRAHGFIVRAPGLTALDLGTVFSVSADPTGTSRLFVFQGQVQALNDEGGNIAVCEAGSGVTRSAGCAPLPFALESGVAHARFEQVAGLAALTDPAETFSAVERIAREADVAARTIPAQDEVRNTKAENNTEDAMNSTRTIVLAGTLAVWNGMGAATTWHVAPEGDDAAAGTSWEAPFKTISNAVAKAAIADEIVVSNGVYAVTVPVNVSKMLTVRALSADPRDTIIDGGGVTNCVKLTAANVVFCGFTVTNGFKPGATGGGGIYASGGATVSNCVVTGCGAFGTNVVCRGGGIYASGCTVTVTLVENCLASNQTVSGSGYVAQGGGVYSQNGLVRDCTIRRCRVYCNDTRGYVEDIAGGGLYMNGTATGCIISDNFLTNMATGSRGYGGGVFVSGAASVLSNSLVTGNVSYNRGGGVFNSGTMVAVTVSNNTVCAGSGGGIFNSSGFVKNCRISDNISVGSIGGGCALAGSFCRYEGCAILNNTGKMGGGLHFLYGEGSVVSNCVLAGNLASGGSGGGFYLERPYSALITHTFVCTNVASGDGGGIYLDGFSSTNLILRNCLFARNTGANGGGVQLNATSNAVADSCTFVENHSASYGSAFSAGKVTYATNVFARNTLFYGNTGSSSSPNISSTYMLSVSNNFTYCFEPDGNVLSAAPETHNVSGDPGFVNYAAGDYRLTKTSPCYNAGLSEDWMRGTTDLGDGSYTISPYLTYGVTVAPNIPRRRIIGNTADIGCCERWSFAGAVISVQ